MPGRRREDTSLTTPVAPAAIASAAIAPAAMAPAAIAPATVAPVSVAPAPSLGAFAAEMPVLDDLATPPHLSNQAPVGALGAPPHSPVAASAPRVAAVVAAAPSGRARSRVITTPAQDSDRLASDILVRALAHGRTCLAVVAAGFLSPLASTDVGSVGSLGVDSACALGANRERLSRPEEALPSAVSEHNSALVSLGGDLPPAGPWYLLAAARSATAVSHI